MCAHTHSSFMHDVGAHVQGNWGHCWTSSSVFYLHCPHHHLWVIEQDHSQLSRWMVGLLPWPAVHQLSCRCNSSAHFPNSLWRLRTKCLCGTDPFVFKDVTGLCGLRPESILADTDFKTGGKKTRESGNYSLVGTHLSLSFATRTPQAKHGDIDLQTQH